MPKLPRRLTSCVASALSILLVSFSPGSSVYSALAQVSARAAAARPATGPKAAAPAMRIPAIGTGITSVSNLAVPASAPAMPLPAPAAAGRSAAGVPARMARPAVLPAQSPRMTAGGGIAPLGAPRRKSAAVRGRAAADRSISGMTREVSEAVAAAGPIPAAGAEAAAGLGARLHDILSGRSPAGRPVLVGAGPRPASWSRLRRAASVRPDGEDSRYFTGPAGAESIDAAARGHNAGSAAPAPEEKPRPAPLWARSVVFLAGLLPAVAVGLPLIASGSLVLGAAVQAAGLALASLAFVTERTPRAVRAAPGLLVLGAGLVGTAAALASGSGFVMAGLAVLGGWGLTRWAYKGDDKQDDFALLTAFSGGMAAVAGVGLVLAGPGVLAGAWAAWTGLPAAWLAPVATGASWLSYPLTLLLFMHLPGWVGAGAEAALRGVWQSVRGAWQIADATRKDTVFYDRLERYSEAKLKLSKWNFLKVAPLWAPSIVLYFGTWLAATAAGLIAGVLQAPAMFLWGAAYRLAEPALHSEGHFERETRVGRVARAMAPAAKHLAAWNQLAFHGAQGSKNAVYNPMAKRLIPFANSANPLVSVPAALLLRALQVLWLGFTLGAAPLMHAAGFLAGFGEWGKPYDALQHDPSYMKAGDYKSPVEKPDLGPERPVRDWVPPGIFAGLLAALPAYFLGLPLLAAGNWIAAGLFLAAAAGLALAPLLPLKAPLGFKRLPGWLLASAGAAALAGLPWSLSAAGLLGILGSNAFWMGTVTFLGGLGWTGSINRLSREEGEKGISIDEPGYILSFFGALALLTGAGVALAGAAGTLPAILTAAAYLASPILLWHLPRWFWKGFGAAFDRGRFGIESLQDVLGFWHRDAKFLKNMGKMTAYYLQGSFAEKLVHGLWLAAVWVPTAVVLLAEWVLGLGIGLATGLVRAPANWLWGALYEAAPNAKATRFVAGFARSLEEKAEGNREGFNRLTYGIIRSMNKSVPPSGRPSARAALALGVARVLQVLFLAAALLPLYALPLALALSAAGVPLTSLTVLAAGALTGLTVLESVGDGLRNAAGEKRPAPPGEEWRPDLDNPAIRRWPPAAKG